MPSLHLPGGFAPPLALLGPPPEEWTFVTWCFVVLGALYFVGFLVFWFRFQAADKAAKRGDPGAPERFNAMLRGFPNTMYAKMMGKKPYEVGSQPPSEARQG